MSSNINGFAKALETIRTKLDVKQNVTMNALEEAANYFVKKLKPHIPVSKRNTKHLRDALKVVIKDDYVQVIFENKHYWYMVEKGHRLANGKRVKGAHFVRNTLDKESKKLIEIMIEKIKK